MVVPGPLQTRQYAREVMASVPADQFDLRVELRMARSHTEHSAKRIEGVLGESALRDVFGGPAVMIEQIRHIKRLHEAGTARIRVLPAASRRWTLAHDGAFVLFEFESAPAIVRLEHFRGPAFLYDKDDAGAYPSELDNLVETTMSADRSFEIMGTILDELERSQ